jgi:hypothetical protein
MLLDVVPRLKQRVQVGMVAARVVKPGLVCPVVVLLLHPLVHGVDVGSHRRGYSPPPGWSTSRIALGRMIDLGVEHADDLAAFIVDDRLALFIPEGRDRVPAFVLRIRV